MLTTINRIIEEHRAAFDRVHDQVEGLSMVPRYSLDFTWALAIHAIRQNVRGDFAEFGVWKGGCSFGLALVQKEVFGDIVRRVWMFDSFQGLPDAEAIDGAAALQYQQNTESPTYYDNCRASLSEAVRECKRLGLSQYSAVSIVPGWFEETVPAQLAILQHRKLALVRIDCDWYRPVRFVLDNVDPLASAGGAVIIDDYYTWDGCARATHDFLSRRSHAYRLRETPDALAAYYIKPSDP